MKFRNSIIYPITIGLASFTTAAVLYFMIFYLRPWDLPIFAAVFPLLGMLLWRRRRRLAKAKEQHAQSIVQAKPEPHS